MLDLSHIPNSQQDVRIFNANGSAWQTWCKPKKCNYVYIMCIGGAGGGGAGATVNNGNAGGGASGAITRILFNAQQLSDILYVQVGLGGAGGLNSGALGTNGTRSLVALQPTVIAQNLVAISGAAGAGGGAAGGSTSAGETVSTQGTATFYTLGNFISTAGRANLVTGASLDITPLTSQITCSGAAGGGFNSTPVIFQAGSILSTTYSPLIPLGVSSSTAGVNGTNGGDGVTIWKPFFSVGGAGGGASVTANGGKGGNGGIGSGGGGGGAGATLAQGGSGGKGGDGLVIIISF
jgi:hypothetical protein